MLVGDIVERHLLGPHEISSAHFVRLDAGLARNRVEDEFEGETDAGASHAAIRQDRALIGCDRKRATAVSGKIVRPRQDARHLRGFQAGGERVGRIGAGIDGGFAVDTAQAAVALGIGGDAVMVLAAIGAGNEMFATILDPAHWMAAMHGEPEEALIAFYAYESQVPRIAKEKERGLRELYGADERTFGYFSLHAVADIYHARVWREELSVLLKANPAASSRMLARGEVTARALWRALDGIEAKRQACKISVN